MPPSRTNSQAVIAGRAPEHSEALHNELAGQIPGFAGLWFESGTQELVVASVQTAQRAELQNAARTAVVRDFPGLPFSSMRQQEAKFTYAELSEWRETARGAFADPHVIGLDLDERANRIALYVSEGADKSAIAGLLTKAGVPIEAVSIIVSEPAIPQITVRDRRRTQIESGFEIQFQGDPSGNVYACTIGANVMGPGGPVPGFVTNSHCSFTSGPTPIVGSGMNSTPLFQNTCCSGSNRVATENLDPPLFTGGPCPATFFCRYSDALFAKYTSSSFYVADKIAETTVIGSGTTPGSLTVGTYRVASSTSNVLTGFTVRKTGRTTGTTQGSVVATCVDLVWGPAGSKIQLLCQDQVQAPSQAGDSGSPVYLILGPSIYHVGILWGGNCPASNPNCIGSRFNMSPWSGIVSDLPGVAY
jgi:hypothetical protein